MSDSKLVFHRLLSMSPYQRTLSSCFQPLATSAVVFLHFGHSLAPLSWGRCWSRNCFPHFSTHSFHCTFIMISMKKYGEKKFPRFVSMEMAAIFDFRALSEVHTTAASTAVKSCTHIADIINEETYTSVFLFC